MKNYTEKSQGKVSKDYVLITPARNEERHIEKTIAAVTSQTVLPKKWVIVDDGSTDRTHEIVSRHEAKSEFICLIRKESAKRDFGSKVRAFKLGYEQILDMDFGFIGNLDADVSFDPDYYQRILSKFWKTPTLGISGGIIFERINKVFIPQKVSLNSVAGAVQLFRRQCYEDIGGYIPLKTGGVDAAAEIMARMHGWKVEADSELKVLHHRRVMTGRKSVLQTRFQDGITNHLLGYHPVFHFASSINRISDRPYIIGGILMLIGYYWSYLRGSDRVLPKQVVEHLRDEQVRRLRLALTRQVLPS